jgi:hypothetical protein
MLTNEEASGNNKYFALDSWVQNEAGNSFPVILYSKIRKGPLHKLESREQK